MIKKQVLNKILITICIFTIIFAPSKTLAEDTITNNQENNITEQEENASSVEESSNDDDYSYSDNDDSVLDSNSEDSSNTTNNNTSTDTTNEIAENTSELEKKVSSGHSISIILIEIFCGIIGVIMLIMANKTTE